VDSHIAIRWALAYQKIKAAYIKPAISRSRVYTRVHYRTFPGMLVGVGAGG
jgi:hypothetical protein